MQDKLVQLVVFGVVAGGFGAGIIMLINTGFNSEDVFAFAGAVVGAAATVAGSAWLIDRSLKRERRDEQSLIREELQWLHQVATAAADSNPKGGEWTDQWRSDMNAMIDVARGSGRFLVEVIASAKTLDFHQREAVKLIQAAVARLVEFHDDIFGSEVGELPHWDERTWASEIEPVVTESQSALAVFRKH